MDEYLERAKELGLVLYQPSHEYDVALLQWWIHLNETGDFDELFSDSQRPLTKFLKIFEPPCILALAFEDAKIWQAVWFTPFGDNASSAFVGFWTDKDNRGARKQAAIAKLLYAMAFNFWQVLVGVTKHEHLLKIHRKLGYNIVGSIPHFMEGEDAWIVYLTKENFQNSKLYQVGRKL